MRLMPLLALVMVPLAACSGTPAETEQAAGTPIPAVDDKAEIARIAGTLSDEGEFSDRAMFKSFMMGKKMYDSGALKTKDTDRFVAATVEEAIAKHRKLKMESAAVSDTAAKRRAEGDITIAQEECDTHKKGFNGQPMVWVNGYDFGGKNYPDPCAALEAGGK